MSDQFYELLNLYNHLNEKSSRMRISIKELELKRDRVREQLKVYCPHVARLDERFPVCKVCGQLIDPCKSTNG